jgi:hypothetical protein
MSISLRNTLLFVAVLATMPALAAAQGIAVPDPRTSSIDPIGVGDCLGRPLGPAPAGFDVAVRDRNSGPLLGATVALDYSATAVRAYSTQNAGTTVNAAARTLSRVATFGSTNFAARTARFDNAGQVAVSANGVALGTAKWRSLDVDGVDGTIGLGDISYFVARYFAGTNAPECNFDASASDVPDLADFAVLASESLAGPPVAAYAW